MLNKLKNKLANANFLKSVLTITSGTIIAQLISILLSPVITRLYSPTDMGILATYTALATVFATISTGCYDQAIVLPEDQKDSNSLFFIGMVIAISLGVLLTIVFIVFADSIKNFLNITELSNIWLYVLGIYVIFIGLDTLLNRMSIRNKHFKVQAQTQVTQQISTNIFKICIGFFSKSAFGLFVGTFVGQFSRVVRLFIAEKKTLFNKEFSVNKESIKFNLKRYKKFPLVNSWSGLVNVASAQLPVILFTTVFDTTVSGYYSLAFRILNLPMILIGQSVSNVFLERAAQSKNDVEDLGRITFNIYKKLLLIGSVLFSFVSFYGQYLFPFVFGEEWFETGIYAQWISIWIIFQLAISPLSSIFIILEKQGEGLLWNILLLVSRLSFLILMPFTNNIRLIIALYSLVSAFFYFIYSIRVMVIVKQKVYKIILSLLIDFGMIYLIQFGIFVLIKLIFKV